MSEYTQLAIILIIFGAVFFAVGILLLCICKKRKTSCTASAEAKIVDIKTIVRQTSNGRKTMYAPVYEFYANGETHTIRNDSYSKSNKDEYHVGQTVTIFYDPYDPKKSYIENDNTNLVGGIAFTIIGGLIIAVAIIFLM
ncbi:MAG: DUF3592 domain-containing protein [Ruminococcus sp.]|nr:DUF3592 domain-containing protein [Ruminococcus sp.]